VFPENTQGLIINPSSDALLLDNSGNAVIYQLNVELNEWVPVIPNTLVLTNFPDDYQIKKDESKIWHILDKDGNSHLRIRSAEL
jgi:hypothetical protein